MKINLLHLKYSQRSAELIRRQREKKLFWKGRGEWLTHNASFFLP